MRVTKKYILSVIKEELSKVLKEGLSYGDYKRAIDDLAEKRREKGSATYEKLRKLIFTDEENLNTAANIFAGMKGAQMVEPKEEEKLEALIDLALVYYEIKSTKSELDSLRNSLGGIKMARQNDEFQSLKAKKKEVSKDMKQKVKRLRSMWQGENDQEQLNKLIDPLGSIAASERGEQAMRDAQEN